MVYALITRKLNVKNLRASLIQTMEVSAMLMWILMGGAAYNSLVNITRLSTWWLPPLQAPIWTACP